MAQRKTLSAWELVVSRRHLPLETETCWFILVSALDFWLTYLLITQPETVFVESNPVALWFLNHWGIKGLLMFKLGIVGLVAVICQIIALQKIDVAKRVLWLGTVIVGCVVTYSAGLLASGT